MASTQVDFAPHTATIREVALNCEVDRTRKVDPASAGRSTIESKSAAIDALPQNGKAGSIVMVEFVEVSENPESEDFVSITKLRDGWALTVNVTERGQISPDGVRSPVYEHFTKRVEAESAGRSRAERAGIAKVLVVLNPQNGSYSMRELDG